MNALIWHKVAGLSGAAAVGLGAYGAHAFKPQDPYFVEVSKLFVLHICMLAHTATSRCIKAILCPSHDLASYQDHCPAHAALNPTCCIVPNLSHALLQVFDRGNKYHLLHSLLLAAAPLAKRPSAVGACTTAGILLFSGSCYAAAFTEDRANAKLAPFGGMSLIAAWLCLLL